MPIARLAAQPSVRTDAAVRLRGRYRTDCFSTDPAACTGTVERISNELALAQ